MMRALASCRRGTAAVEAALVLPVLLTLGLAAADTGAMFSERHRMKAGLASGARFLARARDPATLEADARRLAATDRRAAGGTPRVKGWSADQVAISYRVVADSTGAYAAGDDVRIVRLESVRPYTGFGLLRLAGIGALQISVAHEERWTG